MEVLQGFPYFCQGSVYDSLPNFLPKKWLRTIYRKTPILVQQQVTCILTNHMPFQLLIPDAQTDNWLYNGTAKVLLLRNSIFQNSLFHYLFEDMFQKVRLLCISTYETLKYNGKLLLKYSFRPSTHQQLKMSYLSGRQGPSSELFNHVWLCKRSDFYF